MNGNIIISINNFNEELIGLLNKYGNEIPATFMMDKMNLVLNQLSVNAQKQYEMALEKQKELEAKNETGYSD